jgi:phosphate transport system permease protein
MAAIAPSDQIRVTVDAALRGNKRDVAGQLFQLALLATLLLSLAVLIALLWITISDALPVLRDRGLDFVNSNTSALPTRAGVRQGLVGSLILAAFVAVFAIPLGGASAIYLQEYARDTRINRLLIANIRNLAGVPSVVFGILGLIVFAQTLRAVTGPGDDRSGLSYLSGGLTIAILVMPIVILVSMEALRAVPPSIREAAYGVGATRWEVVRSHVLPYAAPGMFTGVILAMARAFGETAPLLLVGASTGYFSSPGGRGLLDILQGSYTSLPTQIFSFARQPTATWGAITSAAIVVLLVAILAVNAIAILLRNRYERKW